MRINPVNFVRIVQCTAINIGKIPNFQSFGERKLTPVPVKVKFGREDLTYCYSYYYYKEYF